MVFLPIGIIGCVFVTEVRHNDNGVQNTSGLNDYLMQLFAGILLAGLFPALYGDGIFAVLPEIVPRSRNPTPAQGLLDRKMARLRVNNEHCNANHKNMLHFFQLPRYLSLFTRGVQV